MKEFIEKLIGRLEELKTTEENRPCYCDEDGCGDGEQIYDDGRSQGRYEQTIKIIEIVNQFAEEYKTIDVAELVEKFGQEKAQSNDGWIPCSERLPEVEADVLLSLRSLDVYTGFRANEEGWFYVEGEGYVELENVLAYKPLPEPYKENFD